MMRAMVVGMGAGRLVSSAFPTSSYSYNLGCWMCKRNLSALSSFSSSSKCQTGLSNYSNNGGLSRSSLEVLKQPAVNIVGRDLHSSSAKAINFFTPRDDTTLWGRTLKKLGFTEIPKSILKASGFLMYMKVADEVDYMKFFKQCHLPDVYASWFTVVELHVWLLSTRLMQDGKEGRIVRNSLIKAMWEDNDQKSKKLEGALPSARRKELQGLNDQFHATMISYDEGLLGDDHILAGALWRRFLRLDSDSPTLQAEHFDNREKHQVLADKVKAVEMLVMYVRSQFVMLNGLSREQLLRKRAFKFAQFDDSLYELTAKMEKSQIRGASSAGIAQAVKMR